MACRCFSKRARRIKKKVQTVFPFGLESAKCVELRSCQGYCNGDSVMQHSDSSSDVLTVNGTACVPK